MPKAMSKRAVRRRIRELLANEIRSFCSDAGAGFLSDEPPEVYEAWQDTVLDIADTISPDKSH